MIPFKIKFSNIYGDKQDIGLYLNSPSNSIRGLKTTKVFFYIYMCVDNDLHYRDAEL